METVRDFAGGRLGQRPDADAVHQRHCEHYLVLAERAAPEFERSGSSGLLAELDRELNNFRAAFMWALNRPAPVLALRLATSFASFHPLASFDRARGVNRETVSWLEAALAMRAEAVPTSVRAAALEQYAYTTNETRTSDRAEAAARESLELRRSLGDRTGCAASLCALAHVLGWVHRIDEAYECACEAARLAAESGAERMREKALDTMAEMAPTLTQALDHAEHVIPVYRATGNQRKLASLQTSLAYSALCEGNQVLADRLSTEALDVAEMLGDPVELLYALGNRGLAAFLGGDLESARRAFVRQLRLIDRHRHDRSIFEPLIGLAGIAATEGQDHVAASLRGAAEAATLERLHPGVSGWLEERCFAPARARIGERAWHAAYATGARLDRDQAIEAALRRMLPTGCP